MSLLTKEEKRHWGDRYYRNPDGSVYKGPALVAGVSLAGVTKLTKGEYTSKFSRSGLVGVNNLNEVMPVVKIPIDGSIKIVREITKKVDPYKEKRVIDYQVNKREVQTRISLFLDAMTKPLLHMITITFPPCVTDKQAVQYRNAWETAMRKSGWLRHFLWVMERQSLNYTTLHFHIAVFNRIDIRKANAMMKKILKKAIKDGELKWDLASCAKYNGVDLSKHRTTKRAYNYARNRKALSNYLTKYITKDKDLAANKFPGRAWGCSQSLSNLVKRFSLTTEEYERIMVQYCDDLEKVEITDEKMSEYLEFYRWKKNCPDEFRKILAAVNQGVIIVSEMTRGGPLDLFSNN